MIKDSKFISIYKRFSTNQKGSFTIEASLVFPMIFLITILLIFMNLYVYQKSTLYYLADTTAKHAAWNWDNSYKDAKTGAFNPYEKNAATGQQLKNDGLYWRFSDYHILDVLTFNFSSAVSPRSLSISNNDRSEPTNRGDDLIAYKLQKASSILPVGVSGTISYENKFYKRKISVKLQNPLRMPDFIKAMFKTELVEAEASAFVTEPAEFIRNIDFALYIGQKISNKGEDTSTDTDSNVISSILKKSK